MDAKKTNLGLIQCLVGQVLDRGKWVIILSTEAETAHIQIFRSFNWGDAVMFKYVLLT